MGNGPAEYLGINPTGKQYVSSESVHRWARSQTNPRTFEAALHALADELDAAHTWLTTSNDAPRSKTGRSAQNSGTTSSFDCRRSQARTSPHSGATSKRQCASQVIWCHATQGEHLFAPRTIEATQPMNIQRAWQARRNTIWHQFQTSQPLRHYARVFVKIA